MTSVHNCNMGMYAGGHRNAECPIHYARFLKGICLLASCI